MENPELLPTILKVAQPLISAATEIFIKPKIKDLSEKLNLKKKNLPQLFNNKFEDYLVRSYEKYSIINTIVFHNQQKLLKNLYVPLEVEDANHKSFRILTYDNDFLPKYQRVLITDTAGMGKSTLLKRLFLSIIDQNAGIPILIELRRLTKTKDIIDEILEQLSSISEEIDRTFILQLIQKGDFIFLFDGFDEISLDKRRNITTQIQSFINKAGNNLFILTSRPESALSSFGDFKEFKVKRLTVEEAYALIKKYDDNGSLSKQLIRKIKENTNRNIQEFLTNPLLVSLLFAAFEHKQTIPLKKHIFYRQVYDALFESHDLTKGDSFARNKFSNLDVDEFHRVLRHIGYNCIVKDKIEFTKDEILGLIKEARSYTSGLNFKESDLLKDLISTVPLFSIDGIYYKWSHKSLQEYFAGQFIFLDSKEKQKQILLKIYRHKNAESFINLLDLYYSIDYKSFSEVIIFNLLSDFFNYLKDSYKDYSNESKRERQLLTFGYDYIFIKSVFPKSEKPQNTKELWDKMAECVGPKNSMRG
jgi:predicted NACHT family NTPase